MKKPLNNIDENSSLTSNKIDFNTYSEEEENDEMEEEEVERGESIIELSQVQ